MDKKVLDAVANIIHKKIWTHQRMDHYRFYTPQYHSNDLVSPKIQDNSIDFENITNFKIYTFLKMTQKREMEGARDE